MLDAVLLEKSGIPTSMICTKPFIDHSKATATTHGLTDLELIEVFHPIANATVPELLKEAARVVDEVVSTLVTFKIR